MRFGRFGVAWFELTGVLYASLPELCESLELLGPMWGSVGAMVGQRAGTTDVTLSASELASELASGLASELVPLLSSVEGSGSVSEVFGLGVEASDVGGVSVGPLATTCWWSMGP